ncbi:hypothetical protein TPHA_0I01570 [Tetrapisispora phaffii CBS 4417]|uniref:Arginase n=1 Tax=Tetrapisispora phaffii (strain ATCC 24235 / CBS 4417 / NBRC 1672 / NRRL Y-8282 / UCD 70-5) TaxID=1071381 RepID=G8BXN5_TETPH|nr:hypothetical protein TPHA_0I01570 [Tetrapisispora phaffii CBS 4417]CCE64663.1 hypothetical protein TPHA_0I01570 [Tetrapisispora phaffii CBS 4417]
MTFDMLEKQETPHYNFIKGHALTVIKAPFSDGQSKKGVEKGPDYLLKQGLVHDLENLGWTTEIVNPLAEVTGSVQNVTTYKNIHNIDSVACSTELIYKTVRDTTKDGRFALTLGGDHSIAIGTILGALKTYPDLGLLWIDAHADINTLDTTESGNIHGCPVAFAMGLNEVVPAPFSWLNSLRKLKKNRIAYIGLRDIDEGEKQVLKENNITSVFTMYHIDRYGMNNVIEMALKALNKDGDSPILCSYDVDSVDPLYVPATGTPVRGGLTLREGLFLAERLAETGNLVGLDIVECNPDLATNDIHVVDTISAGCAVARCALGETLF